MLRKSLLLMAAIFGGFFSPACTTAQRQELMSEVKEFVVQQAMDAKDGAIAYVDKKLAEQEKAKLAILDEQLKVLAKVDAETGIAKSLTWKDFDENKNEQLEPSENLKLGTYVAKEVTLKVAQGSMTKEEGTNTVKSVGGTLGILLLLAMAKKGVDKVRGNGNGGGNGSGVVKA